MTKITAVIVLILASASRTVTQDAPEDFAVEQLSSNEVAEINSAAAKLTAEQARYQNAVMKVKFAHGQTAGSRFLICGEIISNVEIKGKYALITRHSDTSSCPVATSVTQP